MLVLRLKPRCRLFQLRENLLNFDLIKQTRGSALRCLPNLMQILRRHMKYKDIYIHSVMQHWGWGIILYLNFDKTRVIQRGANSRSRSLIQFLFIFSYKVKTKTPTVYGSVINVRALEHSD